MNITRCAAGLAATFACAASAQIRTDGTLGGPARTLSGPNFTIGEALGRLAGSNLFHSFELFNVGFGESATFVTTTPGLANVVSRVTGGSPSSMALRSAPQRPVRDTPVPSTFPRRMP